MDKLFLLHLCPELAWQSADQCSVDSEVLRNTLGSKWIPQKRDLGARCLDWTSGGGEGGVGEMTA